MLKLIDVEAENFLAIQQARVVFEAGLNLLGGRNYDASADGSESNGAAKSSIWAAIRWCLFGDLGRGDWKADDVVNRKVGKDCKVQVRLTHRGCAYQILRYRKHSEGGNNIRIIRDGSDLTAHTAGETERILADELLPLDKRIFDYAILVGQGMPFRFLSMSEPEKQTFLCSVAGIDIYDRAASRVRDEIAASTAKLAEAEAVYSAATKTAADAKAAHENAATALAQFDDSVSVRVAESNAAMVNAKAALADIDAREAHAVVQAEAADAETQKAIEAVRARSAPADNVEAMKPVEMQRKIAYDRIDEEARVATESLEAALRSLREKHAELQRQRDSTQGRLTTALAESGSAIDEITHLTAAVRGVEVEVRQAQRELDQMSGLAAVCPTCRQAVDPRHVETHAAAARRVLAEKSAELDGLRAALDATNEVRKDRERARSTIADETHKIDVEMYAVSENIRSKQAELERVPAMRLHARSNADAVQDRARAAIAEEARRAQQAIQESIERLLNLQAVRQRDFLRLRASFEESRKTKRLELEAAQRDISAAASDRARVEGRLDAARAGVEAALKAIPPAELVAENARKYNVHVNFWLKAIPQLRAAAMEQVIAYINTQAGVYLDHLSGGSMGIELYQASYGQGSRIKVNLRTDAGSYGLSSGGEQRRVDIALYLAVSDLLKASSGLACNLMVCDEITDGLSPLGVRKFLDILEERAGSGWSVYVTTHNPAVQQSAHFSRILTAVKRGGLSTFEQSLAA